jgi:NAD(P)-dependent dehydrogenase (short-subunit alcohol dehydrogenase family)
MRNEESFARQARRTAASGAAIQKNADKKEQRAKKAKGKGKKGGAPSTGQRTYPKPPLPRQHQTKPGKESELKPAPMFEAPAYRGSDKLLDMVALITGGDSGIGRAVATLFAREGADVAIVYLTEDGDAATTKRVVEAEGRDCILISGDVSDPEFCRAAVSETVKRFGRFDILVNNAAFQQHVTSLENLSEAQFDRTLKTNLYGYFHMAKAALPHLGAGGSIINTGSVTGMFGSKQLPDYAMTKGGIHAFTRSLAGLVLERGIRVNGVAPGPVWTPLNPADRSADEVTKFGSDVPMKRPAQPEEIAPAYVFLAAPSCASYITGEILPIIGGY